MDPKYNLLSHALTMVLSRGSGSPKTPPFYHSMVNPLKVYGLDGHANSGQPMLLGETPECLDA